MLVEQIYISSTNWESLKFCWENVHLHISSRSACTIYIKLFFVVRKKCKHTLH